MHWASGRKIHCSEQNIPPDGRDGDKIPKVGKLLDQQNLRADLGEIVKFGDMFVIEADTAVGRATPDLARVVGAMDAVIGPGQVQRPDAERVVGAGGM